MESNSSGFWTRAKDYFSAPSYDQTVSDNAHLVRSAPVPPSRPTFSSLTPETALTIGPVFRAVGIITTLCSQMELGVYRNNREIPTPAVIRNPDANQHQSAFIEETVYSLAVYGNAYWRIYRSNGTVMSLEVLDPRIVEIRKDKNRKVYIYGADEIPATNVKHLKFMRIPGEDKGVGPIQQGAKELAFALRLKEFVEQWFDVYNPPTGTLSTDMNLSQEESHAFADAWNAFLKTHGGTAVLSQGLRYEAIAIKPADAQYIDVQREVIKGIARIFGIPATDLLAEMGGTSMTYTNMQEASILFLQRTLARYMNEIENALTDLLPRGQRVQFKEETLLRMDTATKTKVQTMQIKAGTRTANEIREEEGLEPLAEVKTSAIPESTGKAGDSNNGAASV